MMRNAINPTFLVPVDKFYYKGSWSEELEKSMYRGYIP